MTIDNFFKAYSYGLRTGDGEPYKSLYTDGCSKCDGIAVNIALAATPGASTSGGGFRYSRAALRASTDPRRAVWQLDLKQDETVFTFIDGSTTKLESFSGPVLVEVLLDKPLRVSGMRSKDVQ